MNSTQTKCGFIAIMGEPNVGKSTLLNQIVGRKISIVTPKVQTTRNHIRAIYTNDNIQIILVDTPGIFAAKGKVEKTIVKNAWLGASATDHQIVVVDPKIGITQKTQNIIDKLRNFTLVINKVDIFKEHEIDKLEQDAQKFQDKCDKIFKISALRNINVNDVTTYLSTKLPNSPFLYDEDDLTDAPSRYLATEITREKLFLRLREELPYNLAVDTEVWDELEDGSVRIHQIIYVAKDTHKHIVIGAGAKKIKEIGVIAREEIEKLFEKKVHLFLYVKVDPKWVEKEELY